MRVMWIGLSSLLVAPFIGLFNSIIRKLLDPISFNPSAGLPMGFLGVLFSLGLAITTIVIFIKSAKSGNGSLFLWMGFVPAVIVAVFWTYMIIGEILFPH